MFVRKVRPRVLQYEFNGELTPTCNYEVVGGGGECPVLGQLEAFSPEAGRNVNQHSLHEATRSVCGEGTPLLECDTALGSQAWTHGAHSRRAC